MFATGGLGYGGNSDATYDDLEGLGVLQSHIQEQKKTPGIQCAHCGHEAYEVHVDVLETNQYDVHPNKEGTFDWMRDGPAVDGSEKEMIAHCINCDHVLGKWLPNGRITVGDQTYWGIGYTTWMYHITGGYDEALAE